MSYFRNVCYTVWPDHDPENGSILDYGWATLYIGYKGISFPFISSTFDWV